MKYTERKPQGILKKHVKEVGYEVTWGGLTKEEINEYVRDCRFCFIENYSCGGTLPSVDVLFLLAGEAKHYQAFIVKDETLLELHQEHIAGDCLTCIDNRKNSDGELEQKPF